MKRNPVAFLCSLLFLPLVLSAEIVLQRPAHDEEITTTSPELRAFLDLPQAERRACFTNKVRRAQLNLLRDAQPYVFQWRCTEGEKGEFGVVISEREDFSAPSPALVYHPTNQLARAARPDEAEIVNLLIGRTYYWKVTCKTPEGRTLDSACGRFRTDASAPRLLAIPYVGNVRDLGGRVGLNGRRIRQGLIYRSSGLNQNSPDYNSDRKKWKKENPADFDIGATKLTPDGVAYINGVLKWRTDLDLRSDGEVGPMKASPAGPAVRWGHISSKAYGDIFGDKGSCVGSGPAAMAKSFRVFCERANYPVDLHCIAGADRTGALSYVLNGVLGVEKDELEKDWEITANSYFNYDKMFDRLAGGFDAFGAPDAPLHKKIEAYLLKIGVTTDEIAAFRAIMLEE